MKIDSLIITTQFDIFRGAFTISEKIQSRSI